MVLLLRTRSQLMFLCGFVAIRINKNRHKPPRSTVPQPPAEKPELPLEWALNGNPGRHQPLPPFSSVTLLRGDWSCSAQEPARDESTSEVTTRTHFHAVTQDTVLRPELTPTAPQAVSSN